jgi:hypothetical protein
VAARFPAMGWEPIPYRLRAVFSTDRFAGLTVLGILRQWAVAAQYAKGNTGSGNLQRPQKYTCAENVHFKIRAFQPQYNR